MPDSQSMIHTAVRHPGQSQAVSPERNAPTCGFLTVSRVSQPPISVSSRLTPLRGET
jgi:hypothetical protein